MKELKIPLREERLKKDRLTTILNLTAILLSLILLMVLQTVFWLLSNPPQRSEWFSQTVQEEIEFRF